MENKVFLGSFKEKSGKWGTFWNLSFNKDELLKMANYLNDRGYVNLKVTKRKEMGKFGETHSCYIDNYVPKRDSAPSKSPTNVSVNFEDIPF
jgi:hypothetical protein